MQLNDFIVLGMVLVVCVVSYFLLKYFSKDKKQRPREEGLVSDTIQFDQTVQILVRSVSELSAGVRMLEEVVKTTPHKVLETIKGSANKLRGDLGEFIQYTKLKADYDTIIPLGDVVDYLAIRYPRDDKPGVIDFIEVKTNSSRLSPSQKAVRDLINSKDINFKSVRVMVDDGMK